jgi:hypothetical protein
MPLAAGPTGPLPSTPRPPRVARPAEGGWGRRLARRHRRLTVLGVLVVALLVVAATAVAAGMWRERDAEPAALCTSATDVRVVVDPSLAETIERVAVRADGRVLSTGVCADVEVVAQAPVETAAELASDVSTTPPDIWVPDSSVWLGRAVADQENDDLSLTVLGSLVSTPLVVATSPEVVAEEDWTSEGPTWAAALTSGREVALPDLAGSSVGVQSLVALRATVEDPEQARGALTSAAVAIDRGRVADLEAGLARVLADGADAPLVPTTEQQVFVANRGSTGTGVVAVRPTDGSTSLDYPMVRVDTPEREAGVDAAAVEGVVRLLETEGREAALDDGFRAPLEQRTGTPSTGASSPEPSPDGSEEPSSDASVQADQLPLLIPPPTSSDVEALLAQLEEISRPSRVLAVFDASASMRGVTPSGPTRAQIAQDAAKSSLALFPDTADIGLWFFAVGMGSDGADHVEVVPIRSLDPDEADVDQRAELAAGVDTLPARLTPGGTGLYDTTLAAVRHLRENHDPEASNSVVLVTDGRDEDPSGISRTELVETLQAEADPDRPVRVIVIGLSADVDADELSAIAEASGGAAYLAERPEDFQAVLFDALRRR